jgi:starvation-inducible DNA-binding protein
MLVDDLKRVQADTFALYAKAHYYHWNVEGPDFVQYHEFLAKIYEELFAAVDVIAEEVRALQSYAPGVHRMLMELTKIQDDNSIPAALDMFKRLLADNDTVMEGLLTAYMSADAAGEVGLSNFLQDRYDAHKKLAWMLRSLIKQ